MSIEAMKQALEALEDTLSGDLTPYQAAKSITSLRQAIAEAEKQDNGKLKVTLQDTPTENELAQYKRMFEAACSALGAIGDALGVDPEEGGAEPILGAIADLKLTSPPQRQWVGLTDEETAECFEAKSISDRLKADAKRIEAKLKEKNI